MSASFRVRLKLKMAVGPFHPTASADVFLMAEPLPDGTAQVEISRIVFPNNVLFSVVGRMLKERMTEQINRLVRSAILDIPRYVPQIEQVTILEISSD